MVQSAPASEIAALILRGFDDYREQFREITDGARARFEQAQWQEAQRASAQRINLYEEKVAETVAGLRAGLADSELLDVERWPIIKSAYIAQIDLRLDDELAETWFNSIFCGLFSHDNISDGTMFVHTTRPSLRVHARAPYTRTYRPGGDLRQALEKIFDDYRFDVPYDDRERDLERIDALLHSNLPDWVCKDPDLAIETIGSVFYRNKGAYLVGRLFTPDEQWPLVFPLLHREGHGIQFDTVITDEAEVSIIFSFTRSYFMVDVPVPAELVAFLKRLLPGKHLAEPVHLDRLLQAGQERVLPRPDQPPGDHRRPLRHGPRGARHGDERVHPARLQHGVQDHQGPLQPVEERRPRHGDPEVPVGEEPRPGRTPG